MPRNLAGYLRDAKAKRSKHRSSGFQFEHLEARHLFSATPATLATPLEDASSSAEQSQASPLELQAGNPTPLGAYWSPIVYAGADFTIGANLAAQLNAELITDGPVNMSLNWSQVSGPGQANFSNSTALNSTVQFDVAGTYVLDLTVTTDFATKSDQVAVVVTQANIVNIDQAWLDAQGDGPYYLDQQGKTYKLQTDVTTDGTAFAIIASNVTLDLNGHTITYDNAASITVPNGSFEAGTGALANGWNFSTAPDASRHQGVWLHNEVYDGNYSLKFALPNGDQHVTSTSTVTLEANTTYSLSAMFEYGGFGREVNALGAKAYVRLVGAGQTTKEVFWDQTNNRGIQLREFEFTTGGANEIYSLEVGISGAAGVSATSFFVDDIKIRRTKTYGVTIGAQSGAPQLYPGLTRFGSGHNSTVLNGNIIQGSDGATWGHGVYLRGYQGTTGTTIHDVNVTVHGANASTIYFEDQGTSVKTTVYNNTLISNVLTVTSRDNANGAVINGLWGDIYNNTILNGPHIGIASGPGKSNIYSNTIRLKGQYTNGFAISAKNASQIHDNIIDNSQGEFRGRGIISRGSTDPNDVARIYNNVIKVREGANNQEYEGANIGGAYGIQLEESQNIEVFGNDVYAYGDEIPAYALRLNSVLSNISIHDNTFRAIAVDQHAAALKFIEVANGDVTFEDNTLITNDGIVGATSDTMADLVRTRLIVNAPIANARPFESDYTTVQTLHTSISFIDTVFENTASSNYFSAGVWRHHHRFNDNIDNRLAYSSEFTTTLQINDSGGAAVPNALVTIADKNGNQVYSGVADANGRVSAVLTEFRTVGDSKTTFSPYTIIASHNSQQVQQQFTADQTQSVIVQIPGLVQSSSPTILPSYAGAAAATQELLAAGPVASLIGSELRITGTDGNDLIKLFQSGKNIFVQGLTGYWSASQVKSIYVDSKGGDDFVSLNSFGNGGNKAIKEYTTIIGGSGTDRVSVGAYHDVYFSGQGRYVQVDTKGNATLNGVALNLKSYATGVLKSGVLTVTGTNGNDNLKFAQVNGKIYITGVNGSFKASKVKSIVVRLQDGNDAVSLNSLANGGNQLLVAPVTIYSGAGTETVRLANGHDVTMNGAGHTLQVTINGTAILDGQTLSWDNPNPPPPSNWFDANVQDTALRSLGHNLYLDGLISRSDILALFNDSKDGGIVDGTELADLRKIADNASLFGSSEYLHKLTNYVAYGSAANTNYQGQALGNLVSGAAGAQMDKLINKWFLGLDRPVAGGTYRQTAGSLFVSGAAYNDIRQGTVGDNYFLASLAETAFRATSTITGMFLVNGDGTYGVKFYNPQGQAEYVTVDSFLPTDVNGNLTYASRGQAYNNAGNELWVALAEKAYAQLNEFGWSRAGFASSGQNSYAALNGGYINQALNQISNSTITSFAFTSEPTSFNAFVSAYNAGKQIGFASFSTPLAGSGIVGNHAYAVVGYNATAQTVSLYNPWGTQFGLNGLTSINWSEIQDNFEYFDRTA